MGALETFVNDLRFGARALARSPLLAATAVVVLALGLGGSAAIFGVVDVVLLRPLDYRDPDRLVVVLHHGTGPVAPANFLDWRRESRSFAAMGAAEFWTPNLTSGDAPEKVWALRMTSDVLPLLGVAPLLGRTFGPDEQEPGRDHVAVLGYSLWKRRFGGDPDVVGRTLALNGETYTVVGVMPRRFRFAPFWATKAELWAPLALGSRAADRGGESLRVFARLAPGVTLAQARSDVAALTGRLEATFPGTNRDVAVVPLRERVVGSVERPLVVLLVAVAFVLMIACANVAHLLLARTATRRRELAVRRALGGSRARLASLLVAESSLLALAGGGLGLLFAFAAIRSLVALDPGDIPRLATVALDARTVVVLFAVSLVTGLALGAVPAWRAGDAGDALTDGARGSTDGARRSRLRSVLMASEFALALVLLAGAGLLIRSFVALASLDPGFDPRHVVSLVVSVTGSGEAAPERRAAFYQELLRRVNATPGVASASAINHLPLAGDVWRYPVWAEGQPLPRRGDERSATYRVVLPGYFATMGLPLLRGRDVADGDVLETPGIALVNVALARTLWPGEDPLGKRVSVADPARGAEWRTVVGLVHDAVQGQWSAAPDPEIYVPYLQSREHLTASGGQIAYLTLVARARGDAASLAPTLRGIVHDLAKDVSVSEVQTVEHAVGQALAQPRFYLVLLATFALVALLLAAAGVYGVMSYAVSGRTREIGVRIALGASRRQVLGLVIGQSMTVVGVGAAVGLVGAFVLTRLMARLLYGVGPGDPVAFLAALFVLALVALAASYLPARRAARIDPLVALRSE